MSFCEEAYQKHLIFVQDLIVTKRYFNFIKESGKLNDEETTEEIKKSLSIIYTEDYMEEVKKMFYFEGFLVKSIKNVSANGLKISIAALKHIYPNYKNECTHYDCKNEICDELKGISTEKHNYYVPICKEHLSLKEVIVKPEIVILLQITIK